MSQSILKGVSTWDLTVSAYDTIPDLRTAPMADSPNWAHRALAVTFGNAAVFDGVFGFYAWDPTSVAADNGSTIIKPDSITGAGRWRLISSNSGGGGGDVATEGDNYCFSGLAPSQVLKVKNLDTALANRVDTINPDGTQTWQISDGSAC